MTDSDVSEFERLWSDQTKDQFVLLASSETRMSPDQCVIYNKVSRLATLIRDNELEKEVKERMVKSGVPVVLLDSSFFAQAKREPGI